MTHGETPGEVEVPGQLVTGDPLDLTRREPGATAKGKVHGSRGLGFAANPLAVFWCYPVKSPRGGAPLLAHGDTPGKVEVPGRLVTGDPLDPTGREPGATCTGKQRASLG